MAYSLIDHFRMLARYNTIVNQRLCEACAQLDDAEYRKQRSASFGSIHQTLNHILLGDRIWMARLTQTGGATTPPLHSVLYDDFSALRAARDAEDARIEQFTASLTDEFFTREVEYVNSLGRHYTDPATLALAHMFNHATHHRSQVQAMLRETSVKPPSLDMHRAVHP